MGKLQQTKIPPAIRQFLGSDRILSLADGSQRSYERTLRVLVETVGTQLNTKDLRAKHINATLAKLRAGGRSDLSLNGDRSNLRAFVGWLHNNNMLSRAQDPMSDATNAATKTFRSNIQDMILTYEQAAECFRLAEAYHPREVMTLALGLYGCMRESEILNLRWKDLANPQHINFYRPKQKSYHKIPVMPALRPHIAAWQAWVEERHGPVNPDWYVVPNRKRSPGGSRIGERVAPDWPVRPDQQAAELARTMQGLFKRAGVRDLKQKGVHTLRRTGACWLLDATRDIRVVRDMLGHANQQTTEIYLQYRDGFDRVAEALAEYNPLEVRREVSTSNVVDLAAFTRRGEHRRQGPPRWAVSG